MHIYEIKTKLGVKINRYLILYPTNPNYDRMEKLTVSVAKMIREDWEKYTPCGKPISGTPFVAFKVPLIGSNWTMTNLMEKFPNMNLLIDLTSTSKYYKKARFTCL